METNKKIYIFALAATGQGISGGDRIFIEFARRWSKQFPVKIYVWEEGLQMCKRAHLESGVKFLISKMNQWRKLGFIVNYFARVFEGIRLGLTIRIKDPQNTIVYSASDFWMDSLPALIVKLRYPKVKWVAAWFQTGPKPWVGFTEGKRMNTYKVSAFVYWFVQLPIKPLISKFADFVLVNNEDEKKQFSTLDRQKRAIVVLGAVDLKKIENWKLKISKALLSQKRNVGKLPKIYDGVFQGRFHPQKGVLELIDIWKMVTDQKPDAKLVMIGDGPLRKQVALRIKQLDLRENIILVGYLFDGEEKYKIFAQSKLVLHPAFYDSGGMAALEAMAFGIPAIGFNLKSFQSYYPKGMVKVKVGDLRHFSNSILELLNNEKTRERIGSQALNLINKNWSWDKRAEEVISKII